MSVCRGQCKASWQEYVDNYLINSGTVSQAAIYGIKDQCTIWASSPDFNITSDEVVILKNAFLDPQEVNRNGVSVDGKLYTVVKGDIGLIAGKRQLAGFTACLCKTCIVIGVYETGMNPGNCYNHVLNVADYFRESGF